MQWRFAPHRPTNSNNQYRIISSEYCRIERNDVMAGCPKRGNFGSAPLGFTRRFCCESLNRISQ